MLYPECFKARLDPQMRVYFLYYTGVKFAILVGAVRSPRFTNCQEPTLLDLVGNVV